MPAGRQNSKAMLWFIRWIISSINIWIVFAQDYPMPGLIFAAVMMAFVGFAEELIFRGFLFKAIIKDGSIKTAIVISSVTFGLGHIVNLFVGQDLVETLDVTSVFCSGESPVLEWIIHIVFLVISVAYCLYLVKRVETPAVNRVDPAGSDGGRR